MASHFSTFICNFRPQFLFTSALLISYQKVLLKFDY